MNDSQHELIVGNYINDVKCETFRDPETGRIRVRPLIGQGLSTLLVIECDKEERNRHPIGTHFITEDAKICIKPDGRIYLRARDQVIKKI